MFGHVRAHRFDVGTQSWTLGNDGGVDVADRPVVLLQERAGVVEEDGAGLVLPACIARREVSANVTERGSAEQGVHNGMKHCIAIGVTGKSQFKGDGDAAQHEQPIGCEGVNIVARADTHGHRALAPLRKTSAICTSSSVVILILLYEPGKIATRCPRRSSSAASSVTSSRASGALWAE